MQSHIKKAGVGLLLLGLLFAGSSAHPLLAASVLAGVLAVLCAWAIGDAVFGDKDA